LRLGRDEDSSLPSPPSSAVPSPRRRVQDTHRCFWAVAVALHHGEALVGVGQREGQPSAAFRPLIHVRVRSVDDPDNGRVWEGKDGGVALSRGRVPSVHCRGDARRRVQQLMLGHHDVLRVQGSPMRGGARLHAAWTARAYALLLHA